MLLELFSMSSYKLAEKKIFISMIPPMFVLTVVGMLVLIVHVKSIFIKLSLIIILNHNTIQNINYYIKIDVKDMN